MVSRRFFINLVIRVGLLSLTCFCLCLSLVIYPNYSVIIVFGTLFLAQAFFLVRYLNQVNKKLENFFLFYLSGV